MNCAASYRISENRLEHLPPVDALMAAARAIGERLTAERTAPLGEEYTGPVLFEGRAGAEVLAQSFVPLLLATRAPDSDNPRFARAAVDAVPDADRPARDVRELLGQRYAVADPVRRSTRPRRLRRRRRRRASEGRVARRERPAADAADEPDAATATCPSRTATAAETVRRPASCRYGAPGRFRRPS